MARLLAGSPAGLLAGLLAAGCGGSEQPRWLDLVAVAEHVTPVVEEGESVLPDGRTVRLSADGDGVRLEVTMTRDEWVAQTAGFWAANLCLPLPRADRTNSAVLKLGADGRSFTQLPYQRLAEKD